MKPDEWVTVERNSVEAVAELIRGRLEAEGIEAVLRGNRVSSCAGPINELNLSWDNPLGGVEVRVHKNDEAAALAILAEAVEQTPRRVNAPSPGLQWCLALGCAVVAYIVLGAFNFHLGIAAAVIVFVGLILFGSRTPTPNPSSSGTEPPSDQGSLRP